jgi:hypothetical protein
VHDADHPQTVIFRVATRIAHNNDVVTSFECFRCYTDHSKLNAATPLNRPANHLATLIRPRDLYKRMRIAEQESDHIALDRHLLVSEVGGGERMVRESRRSDHDQTQQHSFHFLTSLVETNMGSASHSPPTGHLAVN